MATTYSVSTVTQLQSALSKAASGDTILLAAGNYGALDLSNKQYSSYVTLRSADPDNEAVLTSVKMDNSSFIRLNDLHVSATSNGADGARVVGITNSHDIAVVNSEINGKVDSDFSGYYGLFAKSCSNITFANNYVHDVHDGVVIFGAQNTRITGNLVDYIGSDFFKFAGLNGTLIENNTGGGHLYPSADAHADFMQFQGATNNGVIRGNVYLAQNNERAQGIFMGSDQLHTNILIEQNIIYSGKANAIYVGYGSGITVRDNTLLSTPDLGHTAANIHVPSGSVVQNNIVTGANGGTSGTNIILQYDDPKDINYYDKLFVNATAGLGITLDDLRPITGSLAETKGAYARLMDLLDGISEPTVTPTPTPEPTPEPTPTPEPAPDTGEDDALVSPAPVGPAQQPVFSLMGDTEFSGLKKGIVNTAHDKSMEISEGSIAFSFDADNVRNQAGLISKDASYYEGGGNHFSIWIRNGTLHVRFQDEDSDSFFAVSGIKANQEYDVLATFDEDDVSLYLDGKLIGTKDFTMDWTANHQYLQVGGLGWASDSGSSAATHAFDGTISDVMIFDEAMTPQDYNFFA